MPAGTTSLAAQHLLHTSSLHVPRAHPYVIASVLNFNEKRGVLLEVFPATRLKSFLIHQTL